MAGASEIVVHALSTGAVLRRAPVPASIGRDPGRTCEGGERLVGLEQDRTLVAIDLADFHESWRWASPTTHARLTVLSSSATTVLLREHVLATSLAGSRREALHLLDAATGRRLWSWTAPTEIEHVRANVDSERVYVTAVRRDLASGGSSV
ncbi:MAG: PQQ-binding-like beta-propeller repeat protein, partial [Dehalococcoidia bacterium]|nr:PQQ-binding-like beta-propeller repeat protein [Dehalococcoidia bacterium]